MRDMGAEFSEDGSTVLSFGNDDEALNAATSGVAVSEGFFNFL